MKADEVAFLQQCGEWRADCILILRRAKPQGDLYKSIELIITGIDDLAELMTGDRMHFQRRDATTPGPELLPVP